MRVSRITMAEAAAEQIRQLILSGELRVGSQINQSELAADLGISRTPLREALTKLSSEGLVSTDPHRGAVVTKPSLEELRDAYEIREALEALAGRIAADRCTPSQIEALREVLDRFADAGDTAEWATLNTRFHMEIYAMSGRKQLCDLISTMRNRTELFVRLLVMSPERRVQAHEDHMRILDALELNDPEAVEREIRAHLSSTVASVTDELLEGGP